MADPVARFHVMESLVSWRHSRMPAGVYVSIEYQLAVLSPGNGHAAILGRPFPLLAGFGFTLLAGSRL
jgi:hypothetical protein